MNITVLEIDPAIKELAHRWFGVEDTANRKTIIADGIKFISKEANSGNFITLKSCL